MNWRCKKFRIWRTRLCWHFKGKITSSLLGSRVCRPCWSAVKSKTLIRSWDLYSIIRPMCPFQILTLPLAALCFSPRGPCMPAPSNPSRFLLVKLCPLPQGASRWQNSVSQSQKKTENEKWFYKCWESSHDLLKQEESSHIPIPPEISANEPAQP